MEGAVRRGRRPGRPGTGVSGEARAPAEWEALRERAWEADYFQVLGLDPGCTTSEVRDAWLRLSGQIEGWRQRAAGDPVVLEALEEIFIVASDAFEVLSDPDLRMRYRRALVPARKEDRGWPF